MSDIKAEKRKLNDEEYILCIYFNSSSNIDEREEYISYIIDLGKELKLTIIMKKVWI